MMAEASQVTCPVCRGSLTQIFRSASDQSLTSLCEIHEGTIEVAVCKRCGHIRSNALADLEKFYDTEYKILTASVDEDQIYDKSGDRIIYRSDHQLDVLKQRQTITPGLKVLDYGCAKADMSRKLAANTEADIHLFDVSAQYLPFWQQLTEESRWAIYETPAEWAERFDLVMSFFAFEHIADPLSAIEHVASLMRVGGRLHIVVPDTFGNIADFVVADHVNHFTRSSLTLLLEKAGFTDIEIDDQVHRGAFVATATKAGSESAETELDQDLVDTTVSRTLELAKYWSGLDERIAQISASEGAHAIYGSGFYGAYIFTRLKYRDQVRCFLDQNPFQQGKQLFRKPVVAPSDLPADVSTLYIGLNPAIARRTMSASPLSNRSGLSFQFLDEG